MSDEIVTGDSDALDYLSAEVDKRIGYPKDAKHIGTGGRHCKPETCRTVRHADVARRSDGTLGYWIDDVSKPHVEAVKSACVAKSTKTPTEVKVASLVAPVDAATWLDTTVKTDNVGATKPTK